MAKSSENKNETKKKKISKRTLMVRIMAIILCALMLLSVIAVLIPFLGIDSYAAGYDPDTTVRVGLMYGSNVTIGFETKAEHGFVIGSVDALNNFTAMWQVADTVVSATCDCNLANNSRTFSAISSDSPDVGGYHLQMPWDQTLSLEQAIANLQANLVSYNFNIFPAYINGQMCIRIGSFGSEAAALQMLSDLIGVYPTLTLAVPSLNAVSVVNPYTNTILYEHDSRSAGYELGIAAYQGGAGKSTLITPAQNHYEGIFEFSRNKAGTDGVALTNVLTIEEYVECVLPWEIGNTWPIEAQKAFAITARTFALSMLGRHRVSYGFDMCNGTHCQSFMGCARTTDLVRQAVSETAGQILTYNGEPCNTYYSAVAGGVTASAAEVWGASSARPYLTAVPTPWENYASHKNGSWKREVSPKELCEYLNGKGYTDLTGAIASISVNSYAENSSYIYSLTITDTAGHSVTIKTCDKIRLALGAYVNSANFVVGRAGDTVDVITYSLNTEVPIIAPSKTTYPGASVITENGVINQRIYGEINVLTAAGIETVTALDSLNVITQYNESVDYNMISETGFEEGETYTYIPAKRADLGNIRSYEVIKTIEPIILEGTAGNFVFVGRGWGHGVGMSQWGTKNMAELGYTSNEILAAYFPGTVVLPIEQVNR